MNMHPNARRVLYGAVIVLAATAAIWLVRGRGSKPTSTLVATQAVERHDISLTIEASATIEPVDLVEVKSKASGQIMRMPVEVGSKVHAGDLLAQIDTHDVQSAYDQALAAMRAAQAKVDVSRAQKARSDDLFGQGVITTDEHESAVLDFANAQAALVNARGNLDVAKQRLDDATVRAPISGTVLSQTVTAGQVISSATSSVSGGTSLLTMADLGRVRLRALVSETDIGHVRPGQEASVTVDAYPNRTFAGTVEKIEPQAVVVQSVTNFPVLVSIANDEGLLLPGMNGEVSLVVDHREGVLAVPVDAVRSVRDAAVVAPGLGLDADSVRAQLQRQAAGAGGGRSTGARGRDSLSAAGRDSLRARYGGRGTGSGRGGSGSTPATGPAGGTAGVMSAPTGNRAQVVFVQTADGIAPRRIRLGLSDFDWSEVLSGVQEGDQVVLLGVAAAQASRADRQNNIRQRMSSMPGSLGGGGGRGTSGGGR